MSYICQSKYLKLIMLKKKAFIIEQLFFNKLVFLNLALWEPIYSNQAICTTGIGTMQFSLTNLSKLQS